MPKTQKVKYEEMFPHEFKKAFGANPTAYLPIGSLEWHGHHNVLGLDSLKAWKILELVAQQKGGIVFPPLNLGFDGFPDLDLEKHPHKKYDCYHLDEVLLKKVIKSYIGRMIHIGFKTIFILAGHYPNSKIAQSIVKDFENEDVRILVGKEPDYVPDQEGDHAGKWETSLMMELYPNLVNLSLMENQKDKLQGVFGTDPKESSVEYGKEMVNKIVQGIVSRLKKT